MSKKKINKKVSNYIDNNVEFVGNMRFQGSIRIDGKVQGEIKSNGTLIVGEDSCLTGDIYVENIIIYGTIIGNIFATNMLDICKTARISGNINYGYLEVEAGAVHEGLSHQLTEEEKEALINNIANTKETQLAETKNEKNKKFISKTEEVLA